MKRLIAFAAAMLSLCLPLAACGGSSAVDSSASSAVAPTAQPTAEPTPEPTAEPYEANVLTGEKKDADYPEGQRITGIMINNIVQARPQRGLSKADILVEIKVEGGITRFMPLFVDYKDIGEFGPIRSGRDQFFQLLLPFNGLYVHEGQSVVMDEYERNYEYKDLNIGDAGNWGYRDNDRVNWAGSTRSSGLKYEHTLYATSDDLQAVIEKRGTDMNRTYNSTFFNFVNYNDPARDLTNSLDSAYSDKYGPIVSDGEYVEIEHSQSYKTRFNYDAASNTYKMQMYYYPDGSWRDTIDEAAGNAQLDFTNVIVLYTDIHVYPGHEKTDLQCVEYGNGGIGYYCYGGKCEKIFWQKGSPLEALQLYYVTEDGQCSDTPLDVNVGKSYLTVVDLDDAGNFVHSAANAG